MLVTQNTGVMLQTKTFSFSDCNLMLVKTRSGETKLLNNVQEIYSSILTARSVKLIFCFEKTIGSTYS